jgi:hypothetical protein
MGNGKPFNLKEPAMKKYTGEVHCTYLKLEEPERDLVDDCFDQVSDLFKEVGVKVLGDDQAERLVEEIAVFLKSCKEAAP